MEAEVLDENKRAKAGQKKIAIIVPAIFNMREAWASSHPALEVNQTQIAVENSVGEGINIRRPNVG